MKFNNRNVYISSKAVIGKNVRIGDDTIIYDNVEIGDNSTISNNCIIGEPLNSYYSDDKYVNPKTVFGRNTLIRSHTIIYAGSTFGDFFMTGHKAIIREKTVMGINCSVGTLADIEGHVKIGNYVRMHSYANIGQESIIGNFVFIYPYVNFTNDPHPPSTVCIGPTIGDFSQIAAHSVLLPGIKIGKNCLIGVNSTVSMDVPDGALVSGNPGKIIGKTTWIKSQQKKGVSHYPWMYNFDRGMPWKDMDFDKWLKENENSGILDPVK
jgi:acetyltransferase-like isoleucine patch superfamily enzyme